MNVSYCRSLGFSILDYNDTGWSDASWSKYYHHCFQPWTAYAVMPSGVFLDLERANVLTPASYKDGWYPTVSLRLNNQTRSTTVLVHRVLAAMFLPNTTGLPFDKCQVDHINSNKMDYRLDNLQVVAPARNKALAYLKGERSDNIYVLVEDLLVGTRTYCYSLAEASRKTGLHYTKIRALLSCDECSSRIRITEISKNEYEVGRLASDR